MEGKMQLMAILSDLMPAGKPNYLSVAEFPSIRQIAKQEGRPRTLFYISTLIRDFCGSLNVARNLNPDQQVESAAMLLDEAGTFRLEDYAMMFAMAKRGELVKIYETIDIRTIAAIRDEFDVLSSKAVEDKWKEEEGLHLGPTIRSSDMGNKDDIRIMDGFDGVAAGIANLRDKMKENGYEPEK